MDLEEIHNTEKEKMEKACEALRRELSMIRTGRATTQLLDGIKVECYNSSYPIKEIATVGTPQPRFLVVQPWDKSLIGNIEKAILKSDLGLTPNNDGNVIRIPIPPLTEERRKDLVKLVKKLTENSRIEVRNVRREANEKIRSLQHSGDISEDERDRALKKVQELTGDYIKKIDEILSRKEVEIMEE